MITIKEIETVLSSSLPSVAFREVWEGNSLRSAYIGIIIAASNHQINRVSGQYPQRVALRLSEDMELESVNFGGMGGRLVYRQPNLDDPSEKYLAMKGIKVPFRKPQPNKEAVLRAIKRFCENWLKTLGENRTNLCYQDIVNYDPILLNK